MSAGGKISGTGFALTLGEGNKLVCEAIEMLARPLKGKPIDELMADFGRTARELANDPMLRWLGPHKGVVHLALASITNACFDLWAKSRGVPLWKLLLDLEPEQLVALLDLSYLEELLDEERCDRIAAAGAAGARGTLRHPAAGLSRLRHLRRLDGL